MGEATRESPVSLDSVECGHGKRKVIVREREYDALSWQGLKTIGALLFAIITVLTTVFITYYSAEASQNKEISAQVQHAEATDKRLVETFNRFDNTLTEQRKILDDQRKVIEETNRTLIQISTDQKNLSNSLDRLDRKVDRLDDKVNKLHNIP